MCGRTWRLLLHCFPVSCPHSLVGYLLFCYFKFFLDFIHSFQYSRAKGATIERPSRNSGGRACGRANSSSYTSRSLVVVSSAFLSCHSAPPHDLTVYKALHNQARSVVRFSVTRLASHFFAAMASHSFFRLWPIALAISIFTSIASAAVSTRANILVIAKDELTAKSAHFGLQAYGIPYRVLIVPQEGLALPVLNSSATVGNYGGFVIVGDVSYKYNEAVNPFRSALTDAQWQSLYSYQKDFKVRMIRIDVYPEPQFGMARCCAIFVFKYLTFS